MAAMSRYGGLEIVETDDGAVAGVYFGPNDEDGTWRIRTDGTDLKFERRESGSYVTKKTLEDDGTLS